MDNSKKVLNVFGIIFATILSVVLVLLLTGSPILLSSLSLVTPKKLTKFVTSEQIAQIVMDEEGAEEDKVIAELLSTNAAKEVFELYAADITKSLAGKEFESKFTVEALRNIAEENIDELTAFMREHGEVGDMTDSEIKDAIKEVLETKEEELVDMLPKPQELKEQIINENPELESPLKIIGRANTVKLGIIALLVFVSALVFVCRLFDFKGVKWLSIDLFVASGISILVCVGLGITSGIVAGMLETQAVIENIGTAVLSSLTTGVVIRTAVMLVSAIGLIVAYVFIKKARVKKLSPIDTPIVLETLETEEEPKETV